MFRSVAQIAASPTVAPPRPGLGSRAARPSEVAHEAANAYVVAVEGRLRQHFAAERRRWLERYPPLGPGFDALESFVLCGGKRLRPRFIFWGFHAGGGTAGGPVEGGCELPRALVELGAAIELFHAFALIHDDVMDGSDRRRHQPTVHRRMAALHREQGWVGEDRRVAEGFAVLIGDLAFAQSTAMLATMPARVVELFDRMRIELHVGQYLDLACAAVEAPDPRIVADVARFKTAKYTVERPLQLGMALGGTDALDDFATAYGLAVGEAFQLRDDLLGVFGDPLVTGKPIGDDLNAAKRTLLLERCRAAPGAEQVTALGRVGSGSLDADEVAEIASFMRACGAEAAVQRRIAELIAEARRALAAVALSPCAGSGLDAMACSAAWRDA